MLSVLGVLVWHMRYAGKQAGQGMSLFLLEEQRCAHRLGTCLALCQGKQSKERMVGFQHPCEATQNRLQPVRLGRLDAA